MFISALHSFTSHKQNFTSRPPEHFALHSRQHPTTTRHPSQHITIITYLEWVRCGQCNKVLGGRRSLKQHLACVHAPASPGYQCKYCLKIYKNKHTLFSHVRLQQPMYRSPLVYTPVLCPYCGKKISNKYNLKTHVRNIHPEALGSFMQMEM
ncbi:hypothetical protein Pmani_008394 [Petrolisthes manimaculis]|uniref:C2H2-type domain-containing protein n=1 Tax=Petrolisthes manimaculis TaxID=1843537 RepID=A0AAE1Q5Q3_9EUCA|nr:hypothetical protein Pmani_008394 [Petrolisthes manimaculis]